MDASLFAEPDPIGACGEFSGGCDCNSCDAACGKLNGGSCDQVCCGDPWNSPTPGASPTASYLMGMLVLTPAMVAPRPAGRWSWPRTLGMLAIRCYQRWLSPRLPMRCRYVPSCSRYGLQAVQRYGLIRGSRVVLGRIMRCTKAVPHGTPDPLAGPEPR